jgi:hypothetical protein
MKIKMENYTRLVLDEDSLRISLVLDYLKNDILEEASHRIDEASAVSKREFAKTSEEAEWQSGYEEGLAEAQRLVEFGYTRQKEAEANWYPRGGRSAAIEAAKLKRKDNDTIQWLQMQKLR